MGNIQMGNICGKEWASSLDKIIAGRSNVYVRDSVSHLARSFTPAIIQHRRRAESYWDFRIGSRGLTLHPLESRRAFSISPTC
jgi:hypothetical protein